MFTISEQHPSPKLPKRNQVILNQEFVGKGHQLQELRRQRRRVDQQHSILFNEVCHLTKNNFRTVRDIQKQQMHLQYLMDTKKRKNDDAEEKQRAREESQDHLLSLQERFRDVKRTNQRNLSESMRRLGDDTKRQSDQSRSANEELMRQRRENMRRDLEMKMSNYNKINHDKYLGLMRIVDHKSERNKKSLDNYNSRIKMETEKMSNKIKQMELFEAIKVQNTELLERRSQISSGLKDVIEGAHTIDLESLSRSHKEYKSQTRRTFGITSSRNRSVSGSEREIYDPEGETGKKSQSISQQIPRDERISKTIQLIQRSDIFTLIKGMNDTGFNGSRKTKKKHRKVRSRRSSEEKLHPLLT